MSIHFSVIRSEMTRYLVYVIGSGCHFVRVVELDCTDDSAAIESANLADGHDIEL